MLEGVYVGGWEHNDSPAPAETHVLPLQPPRAPCPLRRRQMQLQPRA